MSRSVGRALLVGSGACRAHAQAALSHAPYEVVGTDDPYSAAIELCRRPLAYRLVILCLNSTYREELPLIAMIRKRLRHIDVYVAQTDGRQSALAEAMRLGAAGLLAQDGLHRVSASGDGAATLTIAPIEPSPAGDDTDEDTPLDDDYSGGEAVLTPEELRALLMEQPSLPPSGGEA